MTQFVLDHVDFKSFEKAADYIHIHCGIEDLVTGSDYYTILEYKNRILNRVAYYEYGELSERAFAEYLAEGAIGSFKYVDANPSKFYVMEQSNSGSISIGGNSKSIVLPSIACQGTFQYLGVLTAGSEAWTWLDFDFHLMAPILLDFNLLWMDYSEPESPVILNKDEIEKVGSAYDDILTTTSFIEYNEVRTQLKIENEVGEHEREALGYAGLPVWFQGEMMPRCVKTGKRMKFLCQLTSSDMVKAADRNFDINDEFIEERLQSLDFWGGGALYVFLQPESKIACYTIQTT